MDVKSFGIEINSIIEKILIKKSDLTALIEKFYRYTQENIVELDALIDEMNDTILNVNNTLNTIETRGLTVFHRYYEFIDKKTLNNDILYGLHLQLYDLLKNYLKLFDNYEFEIYMYIKDKLNEIIYENGLTNKYTYNIYNQSIIRDDKEINNIYNKNYVNYQFNGYNWYSTKKIDSYLKKEPSGSLEISHLNTDKSELLLDQLNQNGSIIYEHVIYHPNYGMMIYKSVGNSNNENHYINDTKHINQNYDILIDDDFKGEFIEQRGIYLIKALKDNADNAVNNVYNSDNLFSIIEGENLINNSNIIKPHMRITLSHISSDKIEELDKEGLYANNFFFIHKIKPIRYRNSVLPEMIFIKQNRNMDNQYTIECIKNDNRSIDNRLSPKRDHSFNKYNDSYLNYPKILEVLKDNKDEINENFIYPLVQIPYEDFYTSFNDNLKYLSYRNKKMSLITSVKKENSQNSIFYIFDEKDDLCNFGVDGNIVITISNTKNRYISDYDLFYHYIPKVISDDFNTSITWNSPKRFAHLPTLDGNWNLGKNLYFSPIGIGLTFNDTWGGTNYYGKLQTFKTTPAALTSTNPNNINMSSGTYVPLHDIESVMVLNKQGGSLYGRKMNFSIFLENFSYLKVNFTKYDKSWHFNTYYLEQAVPDYKYEFYKNTARPFENRISVDYKRDSFPLLGIINNELDGNFIFKKDLETIRDSVIRDSVEPIGTLKYIPYNVDNPKYFFNGIAAKAGSVLKIINYPEAFEIFGHKFTDEAIEPIDISQEFALPSFRDLYLVGATSSLDLFQKEDHSLPFLNLDIELDGYDQEGKYTGLITDSYENKEVSVGVNTGIYGHGAAKKTISLNHNSKSPVTKGNDFRLDIYIVVK